MITVEHLLAEVEAVADRMMIGGGGRIQAQRTPAELLTTSGTIVEAADLATLDAVLHCAGLATHHAGDDRRLVEAKPEVVARLAMANDVVLHRLDSPVRAVRAGDGGYLVELDDRSYDADQVVIATGPFQIPRVPEIAERLNQDIVRLHSSEFRGPQDVPASTMLVVAGGNAGFQVAEELSGTHEVHLSIGSRQTPLPQRILGRDLFRYLEAAGVMGKTIASRLGFLGLPWRHTRGSALLGWVKDDAAHLAAQIAGMRGQAPAVAVR